MPNPRYMRYPAGTVDWQARQYINYPWGEHCGCVICVNEVWLTRDRLGAGRGSNVLRLSQLLRGHTDPSLRSIALIGVGGICDAAGVERFRAAGASAVVS